jgi:hypothetical protein
MLEPVMRSGARVGPTPSLDEMRSRFLTDVAALPAEARRLIEPEPVKVRRSGALTALTAHAREDAHRHAGLR